MTFQPVGSGHSGIGALHVDSDGRGHFYGVRHLDTEAVRNFVRITDASGLTRPADSSESYAVLDLYDEAGDISDDRHVMTETDWLALNSELRLEVETVE